MADTPTVRTLGRFAAVGLIVSAPVAGALGGLILWLLASITADPPYPPDEIPALAQWVIAARWFVPWLAAPSLACGIVLWRLRRVRHGAIGVAVAGAVLLLVPVVLALYCFIMVLAPMYTYRELG